MSGLFNLDTDFINENIIVTKDKLEIAMYEAIEKAKKEEIKIEVTREQLLNFRFDKLGCPLSLQANNYHYIMLIQKFETQYEFIYEQALKFHTLSLSTAKNFFDICKSRLLLKPSELLDTYLEKCIWAQLMSDYIFYDEELYEKFDEMFPTEDDYEHLFTLALGNYLLNSANLKIEQSNFVDLNLIGQGVAAYEFSHSVWSSNAVDAEFSLKMSRNALKKVANDPKQAEKKIVRECWEIWQIKPDQYTNKTKFATAMIDKFRPDNPEDEHKHLSSVKIITDWCTKWEREK